MALDKRAWRCQKGHGAREKGHGAAPCYFALDLRLEYYRENYPHVKCFANISGNFPPSKITTFTVNHRHHTLHDYPLDIDQIYATATFLCDPYLDFPVQGHLIFFVNLCVKVCCYFLLSLVVFVGTFPFTHSLLVVTLYFQHYWRWRSYSSTTLY